MLASIGTNSVYTYSEPSSLSSYWMIGLPAGPVWDVKLRSTVFSARVQRHGGKNDVAVLGLRFARLTIDHRVLQQTVAVIEERFARLL